MAGCSAKTPSDTATNPNDAQTAQQGTTNASQANAQEPPNQADMVPQDYTPPAAQPVVSVYVDPPLEQPAPISVGWAPPPMLVDVPPPQPADNQVWTGGYWVWEGNWVWAHGNWAPPPRPGYQWNNPYYDHRGNSVVFVNGFWAAPGVTFVAPSLTADIAIGIIGIGIVAGMRPNGPEGVFIPAPPGSYYGLIVPAPIGTSPAVVIGAAPIIRTGMRVTVNNQSNVSNVTNMTNITNVTVIAPASAMANGKAVNVSVPAQPHLAAAQSPVVNVRAPEPASSKPILAYVAGHKPIVLPPAQAVHPEIPSSLVNNHSGIATAHETAPVRQEVKSPEPAGHALPFAMPSAEPAERTPRVEPVQHQSNAAPVAEHHQPAPEMKPAMRSEPPVVKEVPPIPAKTPIKVTPEEQPMHTKIVPKKEAKPEPKQENKPEQ